MPVISLAGVNQPGDIVLPMARILHVPNPGTTLHDISELPYRLGGMAAKPTRALAWRGGEGNTTLIHGLGVAEAAEIQDMAYQLHERDQERMKESRDERRARVGLPPVENFLARLSDAMSDKATYFKQHAVTGRVANYDPNQKRIF